MNAETAIPPNLRPDAFVGAAADYVRYRLPYPQMLLQSFLEQAALPATGARLIDLACGPGRVALAIADRFDEVLAVDLEPGMIEAGRHEASRRGVGNIRWSVGRAEDFDAPAGQFDLVTIGEAFHRLDRPRVAAKAFGWLKRGGGLVTLGTENAAHVSAYQPEARDLNEAEFLPGDLGWRRTLADVVARFVGKPAARTGDKPNPTFSEAIADQEAVLRDAGFVELVTRNFAFPHEWALPDLLGNLRSTSVLSPHALGPRHAAFENELRAALIAFDPAGRYPDNVRCGYTFARKP